MGLAGIAVKRVCRFFGRCLKVPGSYNSMIVGTASRHVS